MLLPMEPRTHLLIDRTLCGEPDRLTDGEAVVRLETTDAMRVDEEGLVHGGFVFGAADHAAMLAVNHPNVVLGSAEVRFEAPVRVGDVVTATARVVGEQGRRRTVEVEATVEDGSTVLTGTLTCFVLDRHVLQEAG